MIKVWVADADHLEDVWITDEKVEEELQDWEQGQFRYRGEIFDVKWLDAAESELIRLRWGFDRS